MGSSAEPAGVVWMMLEERQKNGEIKYKRVEYEPPAIPRRSYRIQELESGKWILAAQNASGRCDWFWSGNNASPALKAYNGARFVPVVDKHVGTKFTAEEAQKFARENNFNPGTHKITKL